MNRRKIVVFLMILMDMYKTISQICKWIILISLIILPLFFLPVTQDYFDTNKWLLYIAVTLFTLVVWMARLLVTGRSDVSWSPFGISIGLLAVSSILSLTVSSGNKIDALLSPFGVGTWTASALLLFFGPSLLNAQEKIILRLGLIISGGMTGLLTIYQNLGLGSMFFSTGSPYLQPLFTPVGSSIGLLTYLIMTIPLSIAIAKGAMKEQKDMIAAIASVATLVMGIGIILTLWNYIPIARSQLLPLSMGGVMMLKAWNSLPHAFVGVGPEGFFELFTLLRPFTVNLLPIWNIGFSKQASLLLHIGTTQGILGLGICIGSCFLLWNDWKKHPVTLIQALLALLLVFFAPPTFILITTIICFHLTTDTHLHLRQHLSGLSRLLILIPMITLIIGSFWALIRLHLGEQLYYQAFQKAEKGNGSETFMGFEKAIQSNPMNPAYHMALSQTSLLIAENLIKSAPTDEKDMPNISEEDKTLLTDLVTKSIQEAKRAITLSPNSVTYWLNLAKVYQGLVGMAKDADTWAIASYQKAITYDPTNPILHLNLGGLYMSLNREEDAGKEFIIAMQLKPNYIDAMYNLANVFRKKQDWDNAVKALEQTKMLITKGSTDETKITEEIMMILEEKRAKGTFSQGPTELYVPTLKVNGQ